MTKQPNARRLTGERFLFIVVGLLMTSAANTQCQTAHVSARSNASQSAVLAEALQASFGSVVEAVSGARPFYLSGDFNGDGVQDIVIVVRVKGRRSALPKDVHVIDPFDHTEGIVFPANPSTDNKLALAIIHGWKNPQPVGKFLLIGSSPILILESDRPTSGEGTGTMDLMARHAKRRKGEKLPRQAKGDVILLGNEVGGDSMLYWNGRTYAWEDSEGGD
jgi:hypothetical protein